MLVANIGALETSNDAASKIAVTPPLCAKRRRHLNAERMMAAKEIL
jgi:hypothetical protein